MDDILLISNNQILKEHLIANLEYSVNDSLKVSDLDKKKLSCIKLIIIDGDENEKRNLADILNNNLSKLPFLIEISNSNSTIFSDYLQYLLINKPIRLSLLADKINQIINDNQHNLITFKKYQIDINKRIIIAGNKNIKLTELEVAIISYLYHLGNPASKEELLKKVWKYKNPEQMTSTGLVEATIFKIQKKLLATNLGKLIENIDNCYFIKH